MKKICLYYFLISFVLINCADNTQNKNENTSEKSDDEIFISTEQFKKNNFKLIPLTKVDFFDSISCFGKIEIPPNKKYSVSPFFKGYISNINVIQGESVNKNQVLFSLLHPYYLELQRDFLEIKETLFLLELDFKRQEKLFQENFNSEKNFILSKTKYKNAIAKYNYLKKLVEMMNINADKLTANNMKSTIDIYSPSQGHITELKMSNGRLLNTDEIAIVIIDKKHLHLDLKIFEKDFLKIKLGQKLRFQILNYPDRVFNAYITAFNKSVDDTERNITVHADFEDESIAKNFIPGMSVQASIIIDKVRSYSLPSVAVVEKDEENFALKLTKKTNTGYLFAKEKIRVGKYSRESNVQVLLENPKDSISKYIATGAFQLME